MFEQTTLANAGATRWDAVIAGSSFAAMFFLRALPRDWRVLVVEKGALIPHAQQLRDLAPYPSEDYAMDNRSGRPKRWVAHTMVGGNSNCWWGQVPRFHPSDFRLFEDHGHGAPWPLDYATLEPFYLEAERIMEVAGGGSDGTLPRSAPFPQPPHAPSRTDTAARATRPDIWWAAPTTRATGGSRAPCCANGVCDLCPVDSKFTILNGTDQFERPGLALLTGVALHAVQTAEGRASAAVLRGPVGAEVEVSAPLIALGTNAINNAAILLRSGIGSAALGRYLHEQVSEELVLDIGAPNYFGGTSITGHCYGFYDGPDRADTAAVLLENYNAPNALRPDQGRWTERMKIKLIAEDLPHRENRVTLRDDAPLIQWQGHSDYAHAGLARAVEGLVDVLPFPLERIVDRHVSETEAHIQGTHRMGSDPETSVVDDRLECHVAPGVFALGAGAFPTASPANPTLTLSALSLRAGGMV